MSFTENRLNISGYTVQSLLNGHPRAGGKWIVAAKRGGPLNTVEPLLSGHLINGPVLLLGGQ